MASATALTHATGELVERLSDRIVLALPHSDYRLHLLANTSDPRIADVDLGDKIAGHIRAQARRIDIVTTGGRFIDPVYGQPRQMQGRVMAVDKKANTITVNCVTLVTCDLIDHQSARDFEPGMLVNFYVQRGVRFEPLEDAQD